MRVGIYVRISEDQEGLGLGVSRQKEDCIKLAELRGWEVVKIYEDNNYSAYDTRIVRPAFESLIADLSSGAIEGFVVYHLDRLARRLGDIARVTELYDHNTDLVFAAVSGGVDFSDPAGRGMAGVFVSIAGIASSDSSRRLKRKMRQLAMDGARGGGSRPMCFENDKTTPIMTEVGIIRQAALDVDAGIGVRTIQKQWEATGVKTPRGKIPDRTTVVAWLTTPRNIGYQVHGGNSVPLPKRYIEGSKRGEFRVLDDDLYYRVVDKLTNTRGGGHRGGAKYLCATLVVCSGCGETMKGNYDNREQKHKYKCDNPTPHDKDRPKMSISGPSVDELVTEAVLARLASTVVPSGAKPWPKSEELIAAQAKLERYRSRQEAAEDEDEEQEAYRLTIATVRLIKALAAERNEWAKSQPKADTTHIAKRWPDLLDEQRRGILAELVHSIVISKAPEHSNKLHPGRVRIVWK